MQDVLRYAIALSCLMPAGPALAQDEPYGPPADSSLPSSSPSDRRGLYLAIGGGLVLPERIRTDVGVAAKLDDGYMGLAAIGGRIGPLRGELEGSYRRASVGSASGFGLHALGRGHVSALSGMGNLYLEPSFGLGSVRPYFGGGAGISRFRARNIRAVGLPILDQQAGVGSLSGTKTGFAYQGMAGLSGPVSDHLIASFGYRYFATPGVNLDAPLVGRVHVRGLKTHGVEAGLRFPF